MYRFVIVVKYLTNFFKLEWNLGIKFTLRFFYISVYIDSTCIVYLAIPLACADRIQTDIQPVIYMGGQDFSFVYQFGHLRT